MSSANEQQHLWSCAGKPLLIHNILLQGKGSVLFESPTPTSQDQTYGYASVFQPSLPSSSQESVQFVCMSSRRKEIWSVLRCIFVKWTVWSEMTPAWLKVATNEQIKQKTLWLQLVSCTSFTARCVCIFRQHKDRALNCDVSTQCKPHNRNIVKQDDRGSRPADKESENLPNEIWC